jgi:ubiquinone/menaquinone biosynthesis C-methylase UbiE
LKKVTYLWEAVETQNSYLSQYLSMNEEIDLIVDLGCGTGETISEILKFLDRKRKITIIGVDINKTCIIECQKQKDSRAKFILGDLTKEETYLEIKK